MIEEKLSSWGDGRQRSFNNTSALVARAIEVSLAYAAWQAVSESRPERETFVYDKSHSRFERVFVASLAPAWNEQGRRGEVGCLLMRTSPGDRAAAG